MFHMNNEGKIYPCTAKIRKCPYGDGRHAGTREELYHMALTEFNAEGPSNGMISELRRTGRIRSLFTLSTDIEYSQAPVETIISSLEYASKYIHENGTDVPIPGHIRELVERGANNVETTLLSGLNVPPGVPKIVVDEGRARYEARGGRPREYAEDSGTLIGINAKDNLKNLSDDYEDIERWERAKITPENKKATLDWLDRKFNQYSRDLNTSKMVTQAMFFGTTQDAVEMIKGLSDDELLSTYEDYIVPESSIDKALAESDGFNFTPESSLTDGANDNLREWYKRNQRIAKERRNSASKRLIIAMEMSNELDLRGVKRMDASLWD